MSLSNTSLMSSNQLRDEKTLASHLGLQRQPAMLSLYPSNNSDLTLETKIKRLSEDKRKAIMSATADEEVWRESIRQQLEDELTARVQEILASQFALKRSVRVSKMQEQPSAGNLLGVAPNTQMVADSAELSEREKQYVQAQKWKVSEVRRQIWKIMSESDKELQKPCYSRHHSFLLLNCLSKKNQNCLSDFFMTLNEKEEEEVPKMRQYYEQINERAVYDYNGLSSAERHSLFYPFTKTGFQEAVKTGKLPDGSELVEVRPGLYQDHFGIIRSKHGPFWPVDSGPLHPTPVHKHCIHQQVEPLQSSSTELSSLQMLSQYEQQQQLQRQLLQQQLHHQRLYQEQLHQQQLHHHLHQQQLHQQQFDRQQLHRQQLYQQQLVHYPGKWRGIVIVFDSEKSPKGHVPPPTNDGHCPSLAFESRFESGNLRQARRTGQFEYELVLSTDLYTKRHTQWYYFQVQNVQPDVIYTFKIINLLKNDSLYAHGMQPLLYSEHLAKTGDIGWTRTGYHIRYTKNLLNLQCPLLMRDRNYYILEWQMEFPSANDTCFLAHCYPYTFSDLRNDLDNLLADPERSKVMKLDALCETKAGNSCFLVTVTDNPSELQNSSEKKGVVVTARVHPGETNSSWMMKGLLSHITGPSPSAKELRKHFVFKIVPMINPDGVIVGNYRCSLSGHDLNRNYRKPRQDTFPTVWHIKDMIRKLSCTNQVLVYCDLHGHSRKQNVFMYGCAADQDQYDDDQPLSYLRNRLFPWLMAKQSPDRFSYPGCKFHISRCKESTGRVVMYRQLDIRNSYTMEATFCGTTICQGERRHFNVQDFEEMGRIFCDVALQYQITQEDPELELKALHEMLKYLMEQYILQNSVAKEASGFNWQTDKTQRSLTRDASSLWLSKSEEKKDYDVILSSRSQQQNCHLTMSELKANDSFEYCLQLMKKMSLLQHLKESDSSDSDSESEPEYILRKSRSRHRKRKMKKARNQNSYPRHNDSEELPAISSLELNPGIRSSRKQIYYISPDQENLRKNIIRSYPQFINKYEGRSNGGIPCFSEERVLYRAAKRTAGLQKRTDEVPQNIEGNVVRVFGEYQMPYVSTDRNTLYCVCHQTVVPLSVQSLISSPSQEAAVPETFQIRLEATGQNTVDFGSIKNENRYSPDFQCTNCGLSRRLDLTSMWNPSRCSAFRNQQRHHLPLHTYITSSENVFTTSVNRKTTEAGQPTAVDSTASKAPANSNNYLHELLRPDMGHCAATKADRKVRATFRLEEQPCIAPSICQLQLPLFRH